MINKLYILDFIGNRYNLDIQEDETIRSVKIRIRDLNGPHPDYQKILYRGKELNDNENVWNYINIEFNKTGIKHMMLDQDINMKFKIRLEDDKILDVNFNIKKEGKTVLDLKVHILQIIHKQVSNMILSINGIILENDEKLTFLDVSNIIDLYIKK